MTLSRSNISAVHNNAVYLSPHLLTHTQSQLFQSGLNILWMVHTDRHRQNGFATVLHIIIEPIFICVGVGQCEHTIGKLVHYLERVWFLDEKGFGHTDTKVTSISIEFFKILCKFQRVNEFMPSAQEGWVDLVMCVSVCLFCPKCPT